MKAFKFLLLLVSVSFISCEKNFRQDDEIHTLEKLGLSPETLEFFDYYEATDQLVFKREIKSSEQMASTQNKLDALSLNKSTQDKSEFWVFNKFGETEVEYFEKRSSSGGLSVRGKVEGRKIRYKDSVGTTLEFKLVNCATVNRKDESWNKMYEFFNVRYSAPCWTTYLKYKTLNFNTKLKGGKYNAVMRNDVIVGQKSYDDVMVLETPRESAHYSILASKENGIVRIFDQDNDQIWNIHN